MILIYNDVYNTNKLGTLPQDWALNINSNWYTIDEHDHSDYKVLSTDLSCVDDVNFNSFSITQLDYIQLFETTLANVNSLWVSGGDLYFQNGKNETVQITRGNTLDTTNSTIGGFFGDYATSGTALYNGPNHLFSFSNTGHVLSTVQAMQIYTFSYVSLNTSSINISSAVPNTQIQFDLSAKLVNPVFGRVGGVTSLLDTSGKGVNNQKYLPLLNPLGGASLDNNSIAMANGANNAYTYNASFFPYQRDTFTGLVAYLERRVRYIEPLSLPQQGIFQANETKEFVAIFSLVNCLNVTISGVRFAWKQDQYVNDRLPIWIRYFTIKTKQIILGETASNSVKIVYTVTNTWTTTLDVFHINYVPILNGVIYDLHGIICELTYCTGVGT